VSVGDNFGCALNFGNDGRGIWELWSMRLSLLFAWVGVGAVRAQAILIFAQGITEET